MGAETNGRPAQLNGNQQTDGLSRGIRFTGDGLLKRPPEEETLSSFDALVPASTEDI
jgi:hypothetical protein